MISKIISGGQTGVEQAALDAAIQWNVDHGGWIPKGRKTETGELPDKYKMEEMPTTNYSIGTEQNVVDSDGTLIISHGDLVSGSKFTEEIALRNKKFCLHIDLNKIEIFSAAQKISDWISKNSIEILNITGQRESESPHIYQTALNLLLTIFHMEVIDTSLTKTYDTIPLPQTVDDAVGKLSSELPLRDRIKIARMTEPDLTHLHLTLGHYIREKFALWSGNDALMDSCRYILHKYDIEAVDASELIIEELWKKLKETHTIRIVK
ncbi:YpsA SLOG family protein [Thermodesulfobacteriota bacterium]